MQRFVFWCLGAAWCAGGCVKQAAPPLLMHVVPSRVAARFGAGPPSAFSAALNATDTASRDQRQRVVTQARALLQGKGDYRVGGATFEADPVGFVRAAYWAAHIELFDAATAGQAQHGGMEILYLSAAAQGTLHHGQPRPGDLLFLDADTHGTQLYPSSVAVVESVSRDGTVNAVGAFADGPTRIALNLRTPELEQTDSAQRANTLLEGRERGTAARLFRAFADPF